MINYKVLHVLYVLYAACLCMGLSVAAIIACFTFIFCVSLYCRTFKMYACRLSCAAAARQLRAFRKRSRTRTFMASYASTPFTS